MSSYNPFAWAMSAPSPAANTKRKADDTFENAGEVTLESMMKEIKKLKKSNKRIEGLLKILIGSTKEKEEEEEEEEEEEIENDDEEEKEEDLRPQWLEKFEELKRFHKKNAIVGSIKKTIISFRDGSYVNDTRKGWGR